MPDEEAVPDEEVTDDYHPRFPLSPVGKLRELFGQNYSKYLSAEADTYIGDLPEGDTGNYVFFRFDMPPDDWSLGSQAATRGTAMLEICGSAREGAYLPG